MNEAAVRITSESLALEARFSRRSPDRAALITHPHPLYGGDMQNPVVQAVKSAYQKKGYSTLRLNFRGAGKSEGSYDGGRGEIQDLMAAYAWLQKQGFPAVDLAGYSFGAWINVFGAPYMDCRSIILVAPPAALLDFGNTGPLPALKLAIAGSEDEFGPPRLLEPLIQRFNPEAALHVLEGADHFFFGFFDDLAAVLSRHITAP